MASPWRLTPEGLTLAVRVTPNAGTDRIEGVELRDDGEAVLRVRVAAVADKGRANASTIELLSKALDVPKSAISLLRGETARQKLLAIAGNGPALGARIDALDPGKTR